MPGFASASRRRSSSLGTLVVRSSGFDRRQCRRDFLVPLGALRAALGRAPTLGSTAPVYRFENGKLWRNPVLLKALISSVNEDNDTSRQHYDALFFRTPNRDNEGHATDGCRESECAGKEWSFETTGLEDILRPLRAARRKLSAHSSFWRCKSGPARRGVFC